MIIKLLLYPLKWAFEFIVTLFPQLPTLPPSFTDSLNTYTQFIFTNGFKLLGFFIPLDVFSVVIPVLVFMTIAEPLYYFILWIAKKLPFLNIK